MIIKLYISTYASHTAENGINLKIQRCDDGMVEIQVVDDGDSKLVPTFEISYKDIKKIVEKLEYTNEE